MAKHEVLAGQTDYTVLVFIPDSAQTDGSGKTGLVAANLTVSFTRVETDNDVVVTDATGSLNNLAALTTAHTDWGLLEVSSTLAPGLYRLDIADAVFAAGAWSAVVYVMVTTSAAAASPMEFVMVPNAPLTGVLLAPVTHTSAVIPTVSAVTGLTTATVHSDLDDIQARLPAALSAGGNIKADVLSLGGVVQSLTDLKDFADDGYDPATNKVQGVVLVDTLTTYTGNTLQTGDSFARLGAPAGASVSADIAAVKVDTAATLVDTAEIGVAGAGLTNINLPNQTMDIVGNITGNLSGSVGSVTAGVTLAAAAIQAIWDALTAALTTVGSIGKLLVDNINATISSRATQTSVDDLPTNAELATALASADDATLTAIATLNNISAAQVNAEVVDALNVDTYAEIGQEAPAATQTIRKMLAYLYKAWRNKSDQTATLYQLYNDDAATVGQKATVSDDGTTFTSGEKATGP